MMLTKLKALLFAFVLLTAGGGAMTLTARAQFDAEEEERQEMNVFAEQVTPQIKKNPTNAELYILRGGLYRYARDWKRAAADFDSAARVNPKLYIVELERGKMLISMNRLDEAEATLSKFLKLEPNSEEGALTRAYLRLKVCKFALAAEDFALTIHSSAAPTPQLYLERANALVKVYETNGSTALIDEAISGLDEGIKRLNNNISLQSAAVEIEAKHGRLTPAINRVNQAMAKLNRKDAWLARRGDIELQADNRCAAQKSYRAAIAEIEIFAAKEAHTPTGLEKQVRLNLAKLDQQNCGK